MTSSPPGPPQGPDHQQPPGPPRQRPWPGTAPDAPGREPEHGHPPGYEYGAGHHPAPEHGQAYDQDFEPAREPLRAAPGADCGRFFAPAGGVVPEPAPAPAGGTGPPPGHGHGGHGHGSHGGHGHSHSHGPAAPVSRHLRRVIAAVLIPFATAVVVGLMVLWPSSAPGHERTGVGFDRQTEQAEVVRVDKVDCDSVNAGVPPAEKPATPQARAAAEARKGACGKATIKITTGENKGRTFTEIVQPASSRKLEKGQGVVAGYAPDAPKGLQYSVIDVDRTIPMALLAGIFALAVVLVGRMRGVMALIALAVSFGVLTFFILPAILAGSNPLIVAVVGASAIMLIALYMCHGLTARTSVAVLGTLISLLLIGVLGSLFIGWAHLTGNTDDNTGLIHGLYPQIDMSGLLLAGVIIGSLGVLDDVTVTQTSAVWELHQADPAMGPRGLYRAGIRIGRDHIASVVNTLVLAYAGAALPLLLLFSIAQSSVGTVANSELVAEEIVRTLVGSIGLVASVPVTTVLAALVVSADRPSGGAAERGAPVTVRGGGTGRSVPPEQSGGTPGRGALPGLGGRGRRRKK